MTARSLAAVLAGLVFAGCGGESIRATGPAGQSYFPMVRDARWVYSLRTGRGNLEIEVKARGEMELPKGGGKAFVMDETNLGPDLGFAETSPVGYVMMEESYVARITSIDYDSEGGLRQLGRDEPTWILPLDAKPGHSWGQEVGLFQNKEGGGGHLGWSSEVKSRTSVSVPAGRFEDVVEIETHYRDASRGRIEAEVIYRDFYARGVGLVRSITEDPTGDPAHRIEQVLVEYQFPR